NLHNARRAGTPLVNVVGDHAIHHVAYDAPLTSDIAGVAKPVSSWIRSARTSEGLAQDGRDAVRAALTPQPNPLGNISTLIVPADCAWGPGREASGALEVPNRPRVPDEILKGLALDRDTLLLVDGEALGVAGLEAAGRIAQATGCKLFSPTFPARVECGPGI